MNSTLPSLWFPCSLVSWPTVLLVTCFTGILSCCPTSFTASCCTGIPVSCFSSSSVAGPKKASAPRPNRLVTGTRSCFLTIVNHLSNLCIPLGNIGCSIKFIDAFSCDHRISERNPYRDRHVNQDWLVVLSQLREYFIMMSDSAIIKRGNNSHHLQSRVSTLLHLCYRSL